MSRSYEEMIREVYLPGREPGGYVRWLDTQENHEIQRRASEKRRERYARGRNLWFRAHFPGMIALTCYGCGKGDDE